MIELHRLNGSAIVINAELVESVEATPDTVITLTTGRRIMVAEPVHDVIDRVIAYRRAVLQSPLASAEWGMQNAE
jgi:flagellar protein FlbD